MATRLLDEGHYLCSERTMYRILAADQPVRERRTLSANIDETLCTPWNYCGAVEMRTDGHRERIDGIERDGRSGSGG